MSIHENLFTVFILLVIFAISSRILITLIYQSGYALAGLMLLHEKFKIYIGSLGDPEKCITLTLPRIKLFLKKNPLLWTNSLCTPEKKRLSFIRHFISILWARDKDLRCFGWTDSRARPLL